VGRTGGEAVDLVNLPSLGVGAGSLYAISGQGVMRREGSVGGVALLHALKPGLVLPVMGRGELGVAHSGTLRPEELPVELVGVHVGRQKMTIPRARADPRSCLRPCELLAVLRPTQLELAGVLHLVASKVRLFSLNTCSNSRNKEKQMPLHLLTGILNIFISKVPDFLLSPLLIS